jgi:hypothetical protein
METKYGMAGSASSGIFPNSIAALALSTGTEEYKALILSRTFWGILRGISSCEILGWAQTPRGIPIKIITDKKIEDIL